MGFSRQEYWSGSLFPPPGYLPSPGIEPRYPALQADSLLSEPLGKPLVYLNWMEMAISLCDSFLYLKVVFHRINMGVLWLSRQLLEYA